MTQLSHDDLPTALETVFATPGPARHPQRAGAGPDVAVTPGPPPASGAGRTAAARPRLRLVPAPEPGRSVSAAAAEVPPTLHDRLLRLSVADRSLVVDGDDDRGAVPTTDPRRFVHGVGIACVEAAIGRRPAAQLARWVAPGVLDSLQRRADLVRSAGVRTHALRPAARRVRVCAVDEHAAEACLVVDDGVRVRAVALRIEAHRGTWRVTTLDIG